MLACSVVDDGLSDKLCLTKEDCNLSSRSESGEPLGLSSTSLIEVGSCGSMCSLHILSV